MTKTPKDILLKGLLECLPKEIKIQYRMRSTDSDILEEKYNQALSEARQAIKKHLEGLTIGVDEGEIANIIQLRYFKLMFPDITESGAEIVADSLASALAQSSDIIKIGEKK